MVVAVRVRSIVWFATGALFALMAGWVVMSALAVNAAPGDDDATFVPTDGCRAFDFRPPPDQRGPRVGPLGPNDVATVQVTGGAGDCVGPLEIPDSAVGVAMNVTIVGPTAQSNLRLYPSGLPDIPTVSNLNFSAGQAPFPNKVDVKLSAGGAIDIFNQNGQVLVLGDVVGYYTPTSLTELDDRVSALETAGVNQEVLARIEALEADNTALRAQVAALEADTAALETKTAPMTNETVDGQPTIRFTDVNVQIVDGSGDSQCEPANFGNFEDCDGRGNLIIGYNEDTEANGDEVRSGSHNIVVGTDNDYTSHSGIVAGWSNTVSGEYATITGGASNTASSIWSSVSGGNGNTASGVYSSVSGGDGNTASAVATSVSGGRRNEASGNGASVSGGRDNTAAGPDGVVSLTDDVGWAFTSVLGGNDNTASGVDSSVAGGVGNTASGGQAGVAGGDQLTCSGNSLVCGEGFILTPD